MAISYNTNPNPDMVNYNNTELENAYYNSNLVWEAFNFTYQDFAYKGSAETFIVPGNGIYEILASGAQGNNYSSYSGGKGEKVTARFRLEKNEVLTITCGGQNGYNGGGSSTGGYGNGGGCTIISSNKQGILLIAPGGGGAGNSQNGYNGGTGNTTVSSGNSGESGAAGGGGGGYLGGKAGTKSTHVHTDSCYTTKNHSGTLPGGEILQDYDPVTGEGVGNWSHGGSVTCNDCGASEYFIETASGPGWMNDKTEHWTTQELICTIPEGTVTATGGYGGSHYVLSNGTNVSYSASNTGNGNSKITFISK